LWKTCVDEQKSKVETITSKRGGIIRRKKVIRKRKTEIEKKKPYLMELALPLSLKNTVKYINKYYYYTKNASAVFVL